MNDISTACWWWIAMSRAKPARDAEAGEIPAVPARSGRRPPTSRRRNTVFDDLGPAADTA
ncbi:hypothetical protein ABZ943_40660, partial [Streptomyces rubiginosohelvolus]